MVQQAVGIIASVRKLLALLLLLVIVGLGCIIFACIQKYNQPVRSVPRVAHAGGGYAGMTYTDSIEALNLNHDKYELFELDFSFTSDGELVCLHDWDVAAKLAFGSGFEVPPTLEDFNQRVKENPKYKNCTLATLVDWLEAHPGKKVVTDVKTENLRALALMVQKHPALRQRLIPQIYHPSEYAEVKRLGFSEVILTLYRWDANLPYIISRVVLMDLYAVTIPVERAYYARYFRKLGIPTYVHTINSPEGLEIMRVYGVTEIYTDWMPN